MSNGKGTGPIKGLRTSRNRGIHMDDIKGSKALNAGTVTSGELTGEKKKRDSKYNAQKVEVGDQKYDSKREARRIRDLEFLQRAGDIRDLETQVEYILIPKNKHFREIKYIADAVYVDTKTGEKIVEDVKGKRTREYIMKKKLMYHIHGILIKET